MITPGRFGGVLFAESYAGCSLSVEDVEDRAAAMLAVAAMVIVIVVIVTVTVPVIAPVKVVARGLALFFGSIGFQEFFQLAAV